MKTMVPTLSGIGWATEPNTVLAAMFNNMYAAEYDQSTIYNGSIVSMQFEVQRNGNSPEALANALTEKLNVYFHELNPILGGGMTWSPTPVK